MGTLGYNIYLKDSEGNLELQDFTTSNKFILNVNDSGQYTFVVKTTYSIFKSNMSNGKEITINVSIDSPIIPSEDPSIVTPELSS